jgi:hypothetical protein
MGSPKRSVGGGGGGGAVVGRGITARSAMAWTLRIWVDLTEGAVAVCLEETEI